MKKENTRLTEQFQNPIAKSYKETKIDTHNTYAWPLTFNRNVRTLLRKIEFIYKSFRNKNKSEYLLRMSFLFREEYE